MEGKTQPSDHQRNVRQILEGNERVWFHPRKDLLAVWHGGPQVQIVNSRTFENTDVITVKTYNRELSEVEDAVVVKLAQRGFDRCGRSQDNTRVVKA
jgi:hypothetical protein